MRKLVVWTVMLIMAAGILASCSLTRELSPEGLVSDKEAGAVAMEYMQLMQKYFKKIMSKDFESKAVNSALLRYLSDDYFDSRNIDKHDLTVNAYYVRDFTIVDYEAPFVRIEMRDPRHRWAKEITFKIVREDGNAVIMPPDQEIENHVNPWWDVKSKPYHE